MEKLAVKQIECVNIKKIEKKKYDCWFSYTKRQFQGRFKKLYLSSTILFIKIRLGISMAKGLLQNTLAREIFL